MDTYESIRDKKIRFLREWEKKAPMGFQGMRGKKMILDTLEELNKGSVMDFQVNKRILYHAIVCSFDNTACTSSVYSYRVNVPSSMGKNIPGHFAGQERYVR